LFPKSCRIQYKASNQEQELAPKEPGAGVGSGAGAKELQLRLEPGAQNLGAEPLIWGFQKSQLPTLANSRRKACKYLFQDTHLLMNVLNVPHCLLTTQGIWLAEKFIAKTKYLNHDLNI